MGLWDKIKALDPDDVLAYQTIKLVKIRDRRLGGLHHILQLGIFLYIVIYTIVVQQRYLKLEVPTGSFRVTAQQPNNSVWLPATSYPYCLQTQAKLNGHTNYNCVYMLGLDLTYPPAMMDSILVTTRIKDSFYPLNNDTSAGCTVATLASNYLCAPGVVTNATSTRYFTAGIEDYTLYIEHAVFGRQSKITVTTKGTKGTMYFRDGDGKSTTVGNLANNSRAADVFTISTLLQAADLKSGLDVISGVDGGNTFRYDGVLLMMVVEYSNRQSSSDSLKYEYSLYQIPGVSVVAQQPSQAADGGFVQRTWYGVRVIIALTGTIGKFDFPTLLTALVNGMVLVKVAATVVDILLLYVMPDKNLYSKHKFEVTEDFSDVRDREKSERSMKVLGADGQTHSP